MSKIPTAEEFLNKKKYPLFNENGGLGIHYVKEAMIEFAKLHVEAALKEAEKETIKYISKTIIELNMYNKNSILNAYPLTNIK